MGKELHSEYFGGNEVIHQMVERWLDERRQKFTDTSVLVLSEIAEELFKDRSTDRKLQLEIGNALRRLNYIKKPKNTAKDDDGKRSKKKVWIRQDSL